jgi:hypothetical protein
MLSLLIWILLAINYTSGGARPLKANAKVGIRSLRGGGGAEHFFDIMTMTSSTAAL